MFDKAISKFATLGRANRHAKERKRRASFGGLYAADDVNNDQEATANFPGNQSQNSGVVDLNSRAILQLNKSLMRRSQSTESLNISLHQKWRTIDIDIDSPSSTGSCSPDNEQEENLYQDLNVLPLSRNEVDTTQLEVSYKSTVDFTIQNGSTDLSSNDENLYEDTDFVRNSLYSTGSANARVVDLELDTQNNEVCSETTSQDNNNIGVDSNQNTPIDESDSDNEYHDTVVKDLNVIEISAQGIVSKLRDSDSEDDLATGMACYFQSRGMKMVESDQEEEDLEEEAEVEFDGIRSSRSFGEIENEIVKTTEGANDVDEEGVLELNEVLSRFDSIEEDTEKDISVQVVVPKEDDIRTKPKLLPKPKPPLKPKPKLKPAKSLGCIESSVNSPKSNVFAIVNSFESESHPKQMTATRNNDLKSKLKLCDSSDICDKSLKSDYKETKHQPKKSDHEETKQQPKDITSKLTALFSKEVCTTKSTSAVASPKVPPPPPPFADKSRFDSECESLHSGTDVSYSSEQSSGTGSIGSGCISSEQPSRLRIHSVLEKQWSDQSSITSNDGPIESGCNSGDHSNEQQIGDDGDVVILPAVTKNTNSHGATNGNEKRERQVSQRWQRNHLKKVSAQLQATNAVKRKLQKIQSADNLKKFSNYLANKRHSLDLLSDPLQRIFKKKPEVPPPDYTNTQEHNDDFSDDDYEFDSEEWDEDYDEPNGYPTGDYDEPNGDYENKHGWTDTHHGLDTPVAPPSQESEDKDDYLTPTVSSGFMEPPGPKALSGPPTRAPPPPPQPEEEAPPALPARGRGPLPMPPKVEAASVPAQTPAKVLPPPPPKAVQTAPSKAPPPAPHKQAIVPTASSSPASGIKKKPQPAKKPVSKIHQLASAFESKNPEPSPAPVPAREVPKATPPSFLHTKGKPQANHIVANRIAQSSVPNGYAASSDDDEDEDDYQPVGGDGESPIQEASSRPPPPPKPILTPRPVPDKIKGVSIIPGMAPPGQETIREKTTHLKNTLNDLFAKNSNGGANGRKGSVPLIPPSQQPAAVPLSPRKASEPNVNPFQGLRNKFNRQHSVDSGLSEPPSPRVVQPRADRPLPATPQGSPISPLGGRSPAERPLPPVPQPQKAKSPSPLTIPSQGSTPSPPNSGGLRDRPLPAVPQSEEEMTIYSFPWYFGDMERALATQKIREQAMNGLFLVRKSTQGRHTNPYTLIFYDGTKVHNLHIRRRPDNKYALGTEKEKEMAFRSVPELIQYHQKNAIALAGGARTILTTCPPRQ